MKEPTKASERRRSPRIPVNFPATLTCGRKQYRCQAQEFSEFGILLTPAHKELAGEDVELELTLNPAGVSCTLQGVVAYTTNIGIGVRFKNISLEHWAVFRSYIQEHDNIASKE